MNEVEWTVIILACLVGLYLGHRSKSHPFYIHDRILTDKGYTLHEYYLLWETIIVRGAKYE